MTTLDVEVCWTENGNHPWHLKTLSTYHNLANHPSFHSTYLDLLYTISIIICIVFKDIFISLQSIETLDNEIYLPYPTAVATSTTSTMEPPADGGVAPVPSAGNAHSPVAPGPPLEAPKNGEVSRLRVENLTF